MSYSDSPVWKPSMKRPTYWTSIVINPKRRPADIAIRALLHSEGKFKIFAAQKFIKIFSELPGSTSSSAQMR